MKLTDFHITRHMLMPDHPHESSRIADRGSYNKQYDDFDRHRGDTTFWKQYKTARDNFRDIADTESSHWHTTRPTIERTDDNFREWRDSYEKVAYEYVYRLCAYVEDDWQCVVLAEVNGSDMRAEREFRDAEYQACRELPQADHWAVTREVLRLAESGVTLPDSLHKLVAPSLERREREQRSKDRRQMFKHNSAPETAPEPMCRVSFCGYCGEVKEEVGAPRHWDICEKRKAAEAEAAKESA